MVAPLRERRSSATRARRAPSRAHARARRQRAHGRGDRGLLSGRVEDDGVEHAVEIAADPVPPRIWAAASRSARGNPQIEAAVAGRAQSVQLEHMMAVDWEEPLVPATRSLRRTCSCGRPGARTSPRSPMCSPTGSTASRHCCCAGAAAPSRPSGRARAAEPEPIVAGDEIWEAGPPPELGPPRPLPTAAVLKRLGTSGIQVGAQDLAEVLERAYASFAALWPAASGLRRFASIRSRPACAVSASIGTTSSARTCVAPSTTGGATPASSASSQRAAQTHQRSPGCRPSKPHSGPRRREVVPGRAAEDEELLRHHRADRVAAEILRPGRAAAVAEEARQRRGRAGQELAADDVHVRIAAGSAHQSVGL